MRRSSQANLAEKVGKNARSNLGSCEMIDLNGAESKERGLNSEMRTKNGFFKAQIHEKTTDLSMLEMIVYEKRNVNKLVEDELDEFRKEIEAKFAESQIKNYQMHRCSPT